jgi:hypothetical protein
LQLRVNDWYCSACQPQQHLDMQCAESRTGGSYDGCYR